MQVNIYKKEREKCFIHHGRSRSRISLPFKYGNILAYLDKFCKYSTLAKSDKKSDRGFAWILQIS